jgi:uncharacterized membrane protein
VNGNDLALSTIRRNVMQGSLKVLSAVTSAVSSASLGSVTIATVTTPVPGLLGVLGFTTTATVTLPVAGLVVAGTAIGVGAYMGLDYLQKKHHSS